MMTKIIHTEKQRSNMTICSEMIEKDDHDRYLTTLFADADKRRSLNTLYAFNIELSKVLDSSKEPLVSEIKLQWWHDSLEAIQNGSIANHPILEEMSVLLQKCEVSIEDLLVLIDSRRYELRDTHAKTLKDLVNFCRLTAGTLNRLTLQILNPNSCHSDHHHAEQMGTAWGLVGIIRAISFHAASQRCLIPKDLLEQANICQEDLYKGVFSPELKQVIKLICDKAEDILRLAIAAVPKANKNAFLLAPITAHYIKCLKEVSYDIERVDFQKDSVSKLMRLTWTALTGRL